ncbi:MAG: septum formation protein Maf [Chloroflexi bacterium]|nr:septum formation protein Maf [Chloroflexota bacterium]|tara:strand:+ start:155 stop:778 length:624 start_codon:yes stop_codon:yes gene_type:complete
MAIFDSLILGSSSPRREKFLLDLGVKIQKVKHYINEHDLISENYSFEENVKKISIAKNQYIYNTLDIKNKENYVLTADTLVWNSKFFFPKPKNLFDAKNMLRQLKNHSHFVTTAICLRKNENYEVSYETSKVVMKNFSDKYLTNYINSNDVLSKAGSYGIQDDKFNLVKSYSGCYNNVVGLPVCRLLKLFKKMNFRIYNEIVCEKHA